MFLLKILACDAANSDIDCCKSSNICEVGEGDCDSDSDCSGNLICGVDNCQSLDSGWAASYFDCCMEGKWFIKTYLYTNHMILLITYFRKLNVSFRNQSL